MDHDDHAPIRALRRRLAPALLGLTLLAGACVSDDGDSADPDRHGDDPSTDLSSDDILLTSASLRRADDCETLLSHLIDEGVERVGPYGFGHDGPIIMEGDIAFGVDEAMEDDAMDEASSDGGDAFSATAAEGESFSGTNNQEAGVDEADRVKTDGERLVIMRGDRLEVFDVTDGLESERSIRLPDDSWGGEIFLSGDRVLVIGRSWTASPLRSDLASSTFPAEATTTVITEVDLATGDVGRRIEMEGNYLSAREVDGSIRIVVSAGIGRFPFLFPSNEGAEDAALEANRSLIRSSDIDQWLPTYRLTDGGETVAEGRAVDCERMYLPTEHAGFAALTVLTVDVEDGLQLDDSLGILSEGQTVYASTDRLTVTTARVPQWDWRTGELIGDDEDFTTKLHQFDITDPDRTEYLGSGSVAGSMLSQYSLSEHDGVLRVATTEGSPWGRGDDSQSAVTTFAERDGELVELGRVDGLGLGERIFAVRFMGDVAYVVTFRQIDPLYTVDLSDPADPQVLGELKIPGFSTYLHPVADGLLLGVGQDATDEGFTTGAQVSLFDVGDLTDPQRIDQLGLGENSWSPVDWDPKAFLWWGPRQLAVVPAGTWSYDEETGEERNEAAAILIELDGDRLVEVGRVGHPTRSECEGEVSIEPLDEADAAEEVEATDGEDAEAGLVAAEEPPATDAIAPPEEWCWSWQPEIQRSVVIGGSLLTISDAGVMSSDLDGFDRLGWVPFER